VEGDKFKRKETRKIQKNKRERGVDVSQWEGKEQREEPERRRLTPRIGGAKRRISKFDSKKGFASPGGKKEKGPETRENIFWNTLT